MSGGEGRRRYLEGDWARGYPAGSEIRFECGACSDVLQSIPEESVACRCRNLSIDVDSGRVSVRDHAVFRVFVIDERAPSR